MYQLCIIVKEPWASYPLIKPFQALGNYLQEHYVIIKLTAHPKECVCLICLTIKINVLPSVYHFPHPISGPLALLPPILCYFGRVMNV